MEQSAATTRWPSGTSPNSCRICGRVFFDNVNLVLHFGTHLKDENRMPKPRPCGVYYKPRPLSVGRLVPMVPISYAPFGGGAAGWNNNNYYLSAMAQKPNPNYSTGSQVQNGSSKSGEKGLDDGDVKEKNPSVKKFRSKLAVVPQEVVVISDDEDGDAAAEIDLTLKL